MKRAVTLLLISGIFFLSGCSHISSSTGKLQVTTSFYPLYYFTSQITGTNAEVINITPTGVEPHDFEPTARDIVRIENSKLLILNGLGLESWGERIKQEIGNKGTSVIETASSAISSVEETGTDPHIWLDPVQAEKQVNSISTALIKIDTIHQTEYEKNTQELLHKLAQLDKDFSQGLAHCSQKKFITSHTAFGYLAKEYGLEQKSIAGLSPDAEPSARQLADLSKFAKENNVRYIFFESLVSPKLAETLAKEVGAQTLVLNPLEGLTEEEMNQGKDYFSVMRENLKNLRTALDCK